MTTTQEMTPYRSHVNLRPEHPTAKKMVDVTVQMIDAHGEVAVRVQDVVAAAGVQIPVLYRHFGNREGLIQAAHVRRLQDDLAVFLEVGRESANAAKSRAEFVAMFGLLLDSFFVPERFAFRYRRLNILGSTYGRPDLQRAVVEVQKEATDQMVALFEPAQEQGWIRESVNLRAYVLWLVGMAMGEVLVEIGDEPELIEAWNKLARKAAMEALFGTD
jgi:AcrR family transcriptional regulator